MKNYPKLESDRLEMLPYRTTDAKPLHSLWSEPQIRKYLLDDKIVSKEWVVETIESNRQCFEKNGFGQWGIYFKNKSELIGFCGFGFFSNASEPELIYGLAPIYWGQGLATEAVRTTIRYGFENLKFAKIIGSADRANLASIRLMERVGMHLSNQVESLDRNLIYYSIEFDSLSFDIPAPIDHIH